MEEQAKLQESLWELAKDTSGTQTVTSKVRVIQNTLYIKHCLLKGI